MTDEELIRGLLAQIVENSGSSSLSAHLANEATALLDRATPAPSLQEVQTSVPVGFRTEREAYNDWAWRKDGEAVGHLLPHEAAWQAWKARASLHPGREERE
jgi:hypothetical protein